MLTRWIASSGRFVPGMRLRERLRITGFPPMEQVSPLMWMIKDVIIHE